MNLYFATVPVFTKFLGQIPMWLEKAQALAEQKKFEPDVLLQQRLAPDQYPLAKQIQAACDQAKWTVAKLAGKDGPSHPDTEKTTAEIRARVKTVIDYLGTFNEADFTGAEDRLVAHAWMGEKRIRGGDYLDHYALPNFHFHYAHAYAILRHNGLSLGKGDFTGPLPFKS